MGGFASKAGANVARVVPGITKSVRSSRPPTVTVQKPHFPSEGDAVANFKPTKVVEMSRPQAQDAAKKMYEERVPEMDPELLRQAMQIGPAGKMELKHQKLAPDESEMEVVRSARPLPQSRSRVVITTEVEMQKGKLTQTQLLALLNVRDEPSAKVVETLAKEYNIVEDDARALLKYCRAPDVREVSKGERVARWNWAGIDGPLTATSQR